jgi:predicted membrane protein
MRGRWITGAIQILTIFLILIAPSFKEDLSWLGGFLIVFTFAGSTSVLSSRTLAYIVKPIKDRGILWIFTILFTIFSFVLFILLILAIYRFSMGEEGLGIAICTFYGGCIVASVAFVLNILVNIMNKARDK